MTIDVSIIIVDFNSGKRLRKCLSHLLTQKFKSFEVIIVNNGEDDYSAEAFQIFDLNIQILSPGENLGFAKANNLAADIAKGKWLAFLNPDAYPESDWLNALIAATKQNPEIKAFGSLQLMDAEPSRLDGAGDVYHILGLPYRGYSGWSVGKTPKEGEVFAPCAAAALYCAATFQKLNGFDERFFCYGEDVDLGFRLRLSGGKTRQVNNAVVRHEGSGVSGLHSDFSIYYGHRNRIWLAYKNTPFWLYWPFLPLHFLANFYLLMRAPFAGITRPYLKGTWHGYLGLGKLSKDRQMLQKQRVVSYRALAKAITWSPFKISRREGRSWH